MSEPGGCETGAELAVVEAMSLRQSADRRV
jgi:hypothetical protein